MLDVDVVPQSCIPYAQIGLIIVFVEEEFVVYREF
jgi:hypothetical protein